MLRPLNYRSYTLLYMQHAILCYLQHVQDKIFDFNIHLYNPNLVKKSEGCCTNDIFLIICI